MSDVEQKENMSNASRTVASSEGESSQSNAFEQSTDSSNSAGVLELESDASETPVAPSVAISEEVQSNNRKKVALAILLILFALTLIALLYTVWQSSQDSNPTPENPGIEITPDSNESLKPEESQDGDFEGGDGSGTGSGSGSGTGQDGQSSANNQWRGNLVAEGSGEVFDDEGLWTVSRTYAIFDNAWFADRKIIAPGTENTYNFTLRSTANYPYNYKVKVETTNPDGVPVEIRVNEEGKYLVGSRTDWVIAKPTIMGEGSSQLKPGHQVNLAYDWRWLFEQGIDPWDTYLGNEAINRLVNYKVKITVFIEQAGAPLPRTGDDTKLLLWIELVLLALLFIAIALTMRKEHSGGDKLPS